MQGITYRNWPMYFSIVTRSQRISNSISKELLLETRSSSLTRLSLPSMSTSGLMA
uniref:Uncharacterized protein n=1 Tax=Arundo donax TaxID=35708 RepID=A0A0A9A846_ARUDO